MKKKTYIYYSSSPKEEIDLTNSLMKDINLENKDELFSITNAVLELPFAKQIKVIHCITDTMYNLSFDDDSIKDKNIQSFLAQECFKNQRDIILTIVDSDLSKEERLEKISEYEKMFDIKIIDSKE